MSAGNAEGFACNHINLARKGTVSKPVDMWTPTTLDINNYEGGQLVQTHLTNVVHGLTPPQAAVITVCEDRFVVFGPPTATNTMGYCHVRKEEANLFCASKDCKACVARCKSEKQKNICIHLHLLLLYNKVTKKVFNRPEDVTCPSSESASGPESEPEQPVEHPNSSTSSRKSSSELKLISNRATNTIFNQPEDVSCAASESASVFVPEPEPLVEDSNSGMSSRISSSELELISSRGTKTISNCPSKEFAFGPEPAPQQLAGDPNSSTSRKSTLELISKKLQLPYETTKETHLMIDDFNAISHLGVPVVGQEFAPDEGKCGRCESLLGPLRTHPGSKGENKGKAYLVTNIKPFRLIPIYVRFCTNSNCKVMHQADTLKLGEPLMQ